MGDFVWGSEGVWGVFCLLKWLFGVFLLFLLVFIHLFSSLRTKTAFLDLVKGPRQRFQLMSNCHHTINEYISPFHPVARVHPPSPIRTQEGQRQTVHTIVPWL